MSRVHQQSLGLGLFILAAACSAQPGSTSMNNARDESSYQEFEFDPNTLHTYERSALNGDNAALDKVISHYLYASGDKGKFDRASTLKWLKVGADRNIEAHISSFLYLVSEGDADCALVVRYFMTLDSSQDRFDIERENAYVKSCVQG
jgi:hypothetical protein